MSKDLKTLKSYTTQITQLKLESDEIKNKLRDYQIQLTAKQKLITELEAKINSIKNNEGIIISEHAIVRYLERVHNMDIDNIKTLILPDSMFKTVHQLGNGKYPVEDFKIVVKDNVVVTIEN